MQSEYRLETWSEYFTRRLATHRALEALAQRIMLRRLETMELQTANNSRFMQGLKPHSQEATS